MVELVYSNDPLSYADCSIATGRVSLVGQVKGEEPDKEVLQKRTSTAASVEKETFRTAQLAEVAPHG